MTWTAFARCARLALAATGPQLPERRLTAIGWRGAILGRFAGCVLGSIVECWEIEKMERWAAYLGDAFPPVDYWSAAERPQDLKYQDQPARQIHALKNGRRAHR